MANNPLTDLIPAGLQDTVTSYLTNTVLSHLGEGQIHNLFQAFQEGNLAGEAQNVISDLLTNNKEEVMNSIQTFIPVSDETLGPIFDSVTPYITSFIESSFFNGAETEAQFSEKLLQGAQEGNTGILSSLTDQFDVNNDGSIIDDAITAGQDFLKKII